MVDDRDANTPLAPEGDGPRRRSPDAPPAPGARAGADAGNEPKAGKRIEPSTRLRTLFEGIEESWIEVRDRELRLEHHGLVGEFRILAEIGGGGMGIVYEAEQVSLGRRVALKLMSPHLSLSDRLVQKFRREAEAEGRLSHPGIVSVFAVGMHEGTPYIAQELIPDGRTLADEIAEYRDAGSTPPGHLRRSARVIAEIADALAHAHASGVVHRDVKPSNVLLTPEGHPKVGDFGIALVEDTLAQSRTGEFAGTPYYIAPEMVGGSTERGDPRCDIYSLGATLYELITLERPFHAYSAAEVFQQIQLQDPPAPQKIDPRIPRDLAAICGKAMDKDPRRRYVSMREFAADLRFFHDGEAVMARPTGAVVRTLRYLRRHRVASIAVAALITAVVAVSILVLQLSAQRREAEQLAASRYTTARDALGWLDARSHRQAVREIVQADPDDPAGSFLAALEVLWRQDRESLDQAAGRLETCRRQCEARGEEDLQADAAYLYALVRLTQARAETPFQRSDRLREARGALRAMGEFDPVFGRHLIRREIDLKTYADADAAALLSEMQVDREHGLIQLFRGLVLYEPLYKGGRRQEFVQTIGHLEAARREMPESVVTLMCLGRVYFFFARTYDFHPLLDRAREIVEKAESLAGDEPYFMISTTLGQVWALLGDDDRAQPYFEEAVQLAECDRCGPHNPRTGLGRVSARRGDFERAKRYLREAAACCQGDTHTLIALAEVNLPTDPFLAGEYVDEARETMTWTLGTMKEPTRQAGAGLARIRVNLVLGKLEEAEAALATLPNDAIPSLRDFSHASWVLAGLPVPDSLSPERRRARESGAQHFITALEVDDAPYLGHVSPLCRSGIGAARYVQGDDEGAIARLTSALEARNLWRDDEHGYRWFDNACDLYLLTMARTRRNRSGDRERAQEHYALAEALLAEKGPPAERGDILEALRARAREALGFS